MLVNLVYLGPATDIDIASRMPGSIMSQIVLELASKFLHYTGITQVLHKNNEWSMIIDFSFIITNIIWPHKDSFVSNM